MRASSSSPCKRDAGWPQVQLGDEFLLGAAAKLLPLEQVLSLSLDVASALAHLHPKMLLHRDLKCVARHMAWHMAYIMACGETWRDAAWHDAAR